MGVLSNPAATTVFSILERDKDLAEGVEALIQVGKSSFWGWDDGSNILFWMWPKDIRRECKDGCELFVKGRIPQFTKKQRMPVDELVYEMVNKKTEKLQNSSYITSGTVLSLTSFFHVPKGDSDIRLVYELIACDLNEALWAPKFWMPSAENVLITATHYYWFGVVDSF